MYVIQKYIIQQCNLSYHNTLCKKILHIIYSINIKSNKNEQI